MASLLACLLPSRRAARLNWPSHGDAPCSSVIAETMAREASLSSWSASRGVPPPWRMLWRSARPIATEARSVGDSFVVPLLVFLSILQTTLP